MRLLLVSLELPFGVWGLLATQKTPKTTRSKKNDQDPLLLKKGKHILRNNTSRTLACEVIH